MTNIKKDYSLAIIAGFITAIFLLPSLKNIAVGGLGLKIALPFIVPVLWIIGLRISLFLKQWISFTYQFGKFVVVGFLNTAIDFGVLNLLSIMTGLTSGFLVGGVNIPGFVLASVNSYFWNKFWVFSSSKSTNKQKTNYSDFISFIIVVTIGLFINGGIVVLVTTYINPLGGLSSERWLNIAKVSATAISLIWNFVGFKLFVFKK